MPAGWESGLRIVEHYAGRDSANKQTRGNFLSLASSPGLTPGRAVRNRSGIISGTATQPTSSITTRGVRPGGEFQIEAIPEDLILPLLALLHNFKYTQITPPASNREVGTYEFGMVDSKPDHTGAIVGTYDPSAANYSGLVTMSDAYSVALELLYGHGDLGDTDNGLSVDNFIANRLSFEVSRGADQVLLCTIAGFGRDAADDADFAEATWGPGINGDLSAQAVLTPESMSLQTLDVNSVDVISNYDDFLDSLSIELLTGFAGRDSLGADGFVSIATDGRPGANVKLTMAHVGAEFLTALKNSEAIAFDVRFTNGANEYLDLRFPLLRVAEQFAPSIGGSAEDITIEVPMVGVIDPAVADPVVDVELRCAFDDRISYTKTSNTLALIV